MAADAYGTNEAVIAVELHALPGIQGRRVAGTVCRRRSSHRTDGCRLRHGHKLIRGLQRRNPRWPGLRRGPDGFVPRWGHRLTCQIYARPIAGSSNRCCDTEFKACSLRAVAFRTLQCRHSFVHQSNSTDNSSPSQDFCVCPFSSVSTAGQIGGGEGVGGISCAQNRTFASLAWRLCHVHWLVGYVGSNMQVLTLGTGHTPACKEVTRSSIAPTQMQ